MFGRKSNDTETVLSILAAHIRRDIFFGKLAPDSRLKIEELRTRYGGSPHSLREALTRLSVEGLVEANAQRGFRVASATQADLEDITRLRVEIECLGLAWSVEQGDVAWEGRVMAARHALSRVEEEVADDPLDNALQWEEANRQFHFALIDACGSSRLLEIYERLYNQSRRFRFAALQEGKVNFENSRIAHDAILEAAINRDKDSAIDALKAHIRGGSSPGF